MTSNLIGFGRPENMRIAGVDPHKLTVVEGDVFDMANRIKEIDPNLYIVLHDGHAEPWVVMELCLDGWERMVARYAELGPHILEDLRRMIAIPYDERERELQKKIDKENEARENAWMESEAHDRMTWDFRKALEDSNMADFKWFRSFRPKVRG